MKQETKKAVIDLINNNKFANSLEHLYSRWGDESKYEDWTEYAKQIKNISNNDNLTFIKATKRPFGCVLTDGEIKIRIFLKLMGRNFKIRAEITK